MIIHSNKEVRISIGKDSGFISYKSDELSICLNYKGHQALNKSMLDPRLSGCVPIWLSYQNKPLIPAPPYTHGFTISGPNTIPLGKLLGEIYDFNYKWFRNMAYSNGYLSYLKSKRSLYILQGSDTINYQIADNKLILNFHCPIWKISLNPYLVLLESSRAYLRKRIKKPNSINLISKTPFFATRSMIIEQNAIYFKDDYNIPYKNLSYIPFNIRTFNDAKIESHDKFFKILNTNGSNFLINRYSSDNIKLKKELYSSTGKSNLWEIKNKSAKNRKTYEADYILLPESNKNVNYNTTISELKSEYSNIIDKFNGGAKK
jgi:hypothetical protein